MTTRNRRQDADYRTLTVKNSLGTVTSTQTFPGVRWTCVDVDDQYGLDHPLTLIKREIRSGGKCTNFPLSLGQKLNGDFALTSDSVTEAWTTERSAFMAPLTITRIIASTAPERPAVYSLTNLLEIRDIPRLIKHAGDLLHGLSRGSFKGGGGKVIPESVLAYQFGWKPLLDDLTKLIYFGELVAKRQRELADLDAGKKLRRTVQLGSSSYSKSGSKNTGNLIGTWPYTSNMEIKAWATIHWQLKTPQSVLNPPTWWDAFKVVYGLNTKTIPLQLWKALPWSWFVDWFANFSQTMVYNQNLVKYHPSRINRMNLYVVNEIWKGGTGAGWNLQPTFIEVVAKNRDLGYPSGSDLLVTLAVPMLDGYKLSVLGSLAALALLGKPAQHFTGN